MQSTAGSAGFDFNVTMRRTNQVFDDIIAAMKLKGAQNRRDAFAKLKQISSSVSKPPVIRSD